MKCLKCKKEISDDSGFCRFCGFKIMKEVGLVEKKSVKEFHLGYKIFLLVFFVGLFFIIGYFVGYMNLLGIILLISILFLFVLMCYLTIKKFISKRIAFRSKIEEKEISQPKVKKPLACSKCGYELDKGDIFCQMCGRKVREEK